MQEKIEDPEFPRVDDILAEYIYCCFVLVTENIEYVVADDMSLSTVRLWHASFQLLHRPITTRLYNIQTGLQRSSLNAH